MHVNGGSYLGRTESKSGMKACQFLVICHAGNDPKLPVMGITGSDSTGNDQQHNRNALVLDINRIYLSDNVCVLGKKKSKIFFKNAYKCKQLFIQNKIEFRHEGMLTSYYLSCQKQLEIAGYVPNRN